MSKKNLLVAGGLVVTRDGAVRLVVPTVTDGLVCMTADNKAVKVDKLTDDLDGNRYGAGKDVMKVYGPMKTVAVGRLFDTNDRDLLFDRDAGVCASVAPSSPTPCCGGCTSSTDTPVAPSTPASSGTTDGFSKSDLVAGMLVETQDGKQRLILPTSDKGLVAADADSKFIRLDKLNEDMTIADYRKEGKNIVKVWDVAGGDTTDFYSEDARELLYDRNAVKEAEADANAGDTTDSSPTTPETVDADTASAVVKALDALTAAIQNFIGA